MARFFNASFYLKKFNGDPWHFSFHHGLCKCHYLFFETRYHKSHLVSVNVCVRVSSGKVLKNSMLIKGFIHFSTYTNMTNRINKKFSQPQVISENVRKNTMLSEVV